MYVCVCMYTAIAFAVEVENYSVLKSHYLSGGAHGQGRAGGAEHCFGRLGTVHVHGARDDQAGLTIATCFTTNTTRTKFYILYLPRKSFCLLNNTNPLNCKTLELVASDHQSVELVTVFFSPKCGYSSTNYFRPCSRATFIFQSKYLIQIIIMVGRPTLFYPGKE